MRKLTIILLFTTIFGYAQIDYKKLVRNLEDVTIDTDIKTYFKDLPFEEMYDEIQFNDERFLRFYGIIIDKVKFKNRRSGKTVSITPFNEKEDYDKIKAKLIELYGEPEIDNRDNSNSYEWITDKEKINLEIITEDGVFKTFDYLTITFKNK
jgi:hypothetical protein